MDVLNSQERAQLLIDVGIQPPDEKPTPVETGDDKSVTLPAGIVPANWVTDQFQQLKGQDGDGRSREQRSAYNKALYAKLQKARATHNAAVRQDMKADKVKVVSGEVAKRVRDANARTETPVEIPEELLDQAAAELAAKLIAALGQR